MTQLTDEETEFINKREGLLRFWPYAGATILVGIGIYVGWCWIKSPHLISPFAVFEGIKSGSMDKATIETTAVLGAFSMMITWSLLAIGVGFGFAIFGTERTHIAIIRRLTAAVDQAEQQE